MDAHADLSRQWAHMAFCWFCHEAARLHDKFSFYVTLADGVLPIDSQINITQIILPCICIFKFFVSHSKLIVQDLNGLTVFIIDPLQRENS